MIIKNKKVFLILIPVFLLILIGVYYLINRNISIPGKGPLICSSYSSDACPSACVVCPPCPECSSISCQSEDFCAGIGFNRNWSKQLKTPDETPKTDAKVTCGRENCHGLDIKCGPNPAEVCTAMYALGDKCLQYAECAIVDGQCGLKLSERFNTCKSCVDKCSKQYQSDVVKMFECESQCE